MVSECDSCFFFLFIGSRDPKPTAPITPAAAEAIEETTDEEEAFWSNIPESESETEKYGVCKYPMSEAGIPASMEEHGFRGVTTGYAVIDLTPDNPKYPAGMAEAMIEAGRQGCIEAIRSAHSAQDEKAIAAVNQKYDERLRLYRAGIRQWDTSVSVTLVIRGIK